MRVPDLPDDVAVDRNGSVVFVLKLNGGGFIRALELSWYTREFR